MDAFNELGIGRGFMMSAYKGLKLKEAISLYIELLEKWYRDFYFDQSRNSVEKDYGITKGILLNMLEMYK